MMGLYEGEKVSVLAEKWTACAGKAILVLQGIVWPVERVSGAVVTRIFDTSKI